MSWLKSGDTSATYPPLMRVSALDQADERALNEVAGFLWRISTQSAAHLTDSVVDFGTCMLFGGERTLILVEMAVTVGLLEWVDVDGQEAVKIVEDPDFINIETRASVEKRRGRLKDNVPWTIKGPVHVRDGDNCRWCGTDVHWTGTKNWRSGHLDHLDPDRVGERDPNLIVVACAKCNQSRKDEKPGNWKTPLLDPPESPRYGKWIRNQLVDHGFLRDTSEGISVVVDPGSPDQTASAGPTIVDPGVTISRSASEGISVVVDPGSPDQTAPAGPTDSDPGTHSVDTSVTLSQHSVHTTSPPVHSMGYTVHGRDGTRGGTGTGREGDRTIRSNTPSKKRRRKR